MGGKGKNKDKSKRQSKKTRAPAFKWPDNLETRFCETLEDYPCLWNSYEDSYTSRDVRPAALAEFGKHFGMTGEYTKNIIQ